MRDSRENSGKGRTGKCGTGPSTGPKARQSAKLVPLRPRRKCPICGKMASREAYPFCSVACADIDLDRWLSGRYRIAGSADDDDVAAAAEPISGKRHADELPDAE